MIVRSHFIDKFKSFVVPTSYGCIEWSGSHNKKGYGWINDGERMQLAHRASWFIEHNEWPKLCVLHKCDNPGCVNIEHLFLGTYWDNNDDRIAKGRTATKANGRKRLDLLPTRENRQKYGWRTANKANGRWRGSVPRKTHCSLGHAISGDNITVYGKTRLHKCRICYNAHMRAYNAKRKAAK